MEFFNSLNLTQIKGGTKLKQGDLGSVLSYSLTDENGQEITSFDNKTAYINLVLDDKIWFTTTTKVDISRVTFRIDKAIPIGLYYLEIKIDDYIFPSDRDSIILIEEGSTPYDLKELVPNYDVNMTLKGILSDLSQKGIDITDLNRRIGNVNAELTAQLAEKVNKDEVTNVMTPKGNIAYASLPMTGNSVGWYYYCPDGDGTHGAGNYVWNGTSWFFGGTGDEGYNLLKKDLDYSNKIISDILECDLNSIKVEKGGINKSDYAENDLKYFNRTDYMRVKAGTVISMAEDWLVGVFYYDENKNPLKTSLNADGSSSLVNYHTIQEDSFVRLVFRYMNMDITQEELDTKLWKENTTITVPTFNEYNKKWNKIPFSIRNISIGSDNKIYKQTSETDTLVSMVFQISKGKSYRIHSNYSTNCKIGLVSQINVGQKVKTIVENTVGLSGEYNTDFINDTDYNYAIVFLFIGNTGYNAEKNYVLESVEYDKETEIYFRPKTLLKGIRTDLTNGFNVDGDISWTSSQIIDRIYEPLREKYPEYITRENIGKDASGNYDMWCYVFSHDYYDRTVYIQGGTHSAETEGYWAVCRFVQLLCDHHSEYAELEELYQTTRFVVVPIVNVYGVSTKGQYIEGSYGYNSNSWHMSVNANGVNLNRDGNDESQIETVNIHRNFDKYVDESLVLAIDSHTTTMRTWGDYLFVCEGTGSQIARMLRTNTYLLNANTKDRPTNNVFMGLSKDYPIGYPNTTSYGITGSFIQYFNSKGVKALTTEWSDYVYDESIGTDIAITRATENLVNQIIQNTIKYKSV